MEARIVKKRIFIKILFDGTILPFLERRAER